MYLDGKWYALTANKGTYNDSDPIGVLDVTILSDQILAPILNIKDLRTDKRIEFVGGYVGLGELGKTCKQWRDASCICLFPVYMKQLMNIADG